MTELEKNIKAKMIENEIESSVYFCEKINITRRTLFTIFKTEDCRVSVLRKMCEVLKCSSTDLLGY